jgi:methyl-accepting chemotaxis protein
VKLSIAWRIALGFVVPLVLFGVMAGTAIVQMNAMQAITKTVSDRVALNAAARDILLQLVNLEAGVRAYVDTGNARFVDDYERGSTQLAQDVDLVANATGDSRLTAAFADAKTQIAAITKYYDSEVSLVDKKQRAMALAHIGDGKTLVDVYRDTDKKLRVETNTFLQISAEEGSRARVIAVGTMVGLGTLAVAVVVLTALLLGRGIAARIARVQVALGEVVRTDFPAISEAFDRLAVGDLTAHIDTQIATIADHRRDEVGDLSRSFNELADGLRILIERYYATVAILREVISGSKNVALQQLEASSSVSGITSEATLAVEEIAQAILALAADAQDQAQLVTDANTAVGSLSAMSAEIAMGAGHQAIALAATVTEVTALNDEIARLATIGDELAAAAQNAGGETRSGRDAVQITAETMSRLHVSAAASAKTMSALVERSVAIEEIVNAIDEIAVQSNLLALNAAIEAARAGEHGRGFAVVADEVRKLAIRSGQSTKEIGAILSAIQKETIGVAEQMRASASAIDEGLRVAERARVAIDSVEAAIQQTSSTAAAMRDQSATMAQASRRLTDNVSSVSAVVEQNAAAASSMQQTTQSVLDAIVPIEALAETQSHAAGRVSSASSRLRDEVRTIDMRVQELSGRASELNDVMAAFNVGDAEEENLESSALRAATEPVKLYAVTGGRL